jgi:acyl-CoA reductase-like NAD-dependent aldehyde dehydrogenase
MTITPPIHPLYLANRPETPNADLEVRDKFNDTIIAHIPLADAATIDRAIGAAQAAAPALRAMPSHARQAVLEHCVVRFTARKAKLAEMLCAEAGKPIADARGEVARLIDTFKIAAEESVRIVGEVLPLDRTPRSAGYLGFWKRVPIGPCSFISPFNFPLNLAAHKIAPALAVGCPFVLKPASLTPLGALAIGEVLAETDLPAGAFSILPCRRDAAELFTTDARFKLLSFTGSPDVGWDLKHRAGRKRVVLELGGNAAVIVDEGVDLDDAARRIALGAFYQSGQSCISVQRIFIHEKIYDDFKTKLLTETAAYKSGDPRDEATRIGPIISDEEAARIESWIQSAVASGARVLCGGTRRGRIVEATLLENVPESAEISCREVFGPVALLAPFKDFDEALDAVNGSEFGLQAGVFTRDIHKAHRAWDRLEVGGVVINEAPSWRVDHMPYGGVKSSGFGREGIRWAIEDMSEVRLMIVREETR